MGVTSALFTGLSGLNVNQQRLNVVGNNIANVNTVAFKSSRALFKPQFYVTDSAGSPSSAEFGGTNPSQRGLGAVVASIEKDFSSGSIEPTGKSTDMAIDGNGFFVVQSGQQQKFTRDGSFKLNDANQLVTTAGDFVQGFGIDSSFNVIPGKLQNITIPLGTQTSAQATANVTMEGNLKADGDVATGASVLETVDLTTVTNTLPGPTTTLVTLSKASAPTTPVFTAGDVLTLQGQKGGRTINPPLTFTVGAGSTLQELQQFFQQGTQIDTSVAALSPPPPGPTPGVTLVPGTNAATMVRLTITGNTGTENRLDLTGAFKNATGATPFGFVAAPGNNPNGQSVWTSIEAYDSLGTPVTLEVTAVLEESIDTGNTWRFYVMSPSDTDAATFTPGSPTAGAVLGTGTLTFDNDGVLTKSSGTTISLDRANTGARTPQQVTIDFSSMTSLTDRKSSLVMTKQDGSAIGTLNDFSIGADGTITGSYSNGKTRTLGQVAVATFKNQSGLIDMGGNMYKSGSNSGVPIISGPLELGAGGIRSGALELSNVDLSQEFINMIVSSTGFSAASRVITTSDQLIQELLNTSR